jgi:hypothetical protein
MPGGYGGAIATREAQKGRGRVLASRGTSPSASAGICSKRREVGAREGVGVARDESEPFCWHLRRGRGGPGGRGEVGCVLTSHGTLPSPFRWYLLRGKGGEGERAALVSQVCCSAALEIECCYRVVEMSLLRDIPGLID